MSGVLSIFFSVMFLAGILLGLCLAIMIIPTPGRARRAGADSHIGLPIAGIIAGLLFGLLIRFQGMIGKSQLIEVMSFAFIIVTPIVLGFLTVVIAEWQGRLYWKKRFMLPWATASLCLGATLLLAWEGIICTLMFLPLFLILASIGGLAGGIVSFYRLPKHPTTLCLGLALLLPFATAQVEEKFTLQQNITTVTNKILIEAPAEKVWEKIESVAPFRAEEHGFSWTHLMGFPRPVSAELEGKGVGAVRMAIFEGQLVFTERVTEWQQDKILAFSIHANTETIPPTTLDEHVTIGGKYFDVLEGRYEIEVLPSGGSLLHLQSQFRTSTRFEPYTRLWARFIMGDLQQYILERIKSRAEDSTLADSAEQEI